MRRNDDWLVFYLVIVCVANDDGLVEPDYFQVFLVDLVDMLNRLDLVLALVPHVLSLLRLPLVLVFFHDMVPELLIVTPVVLVCNVLSLHLFGKGVHEI